VSSLEKNRAEAILELPELGTQRRLRDMTGLGGPAEMAVFGERNEITEFLQGHDPNNSSDQSITRGRSPDPSRRRTTRWC
jgi:hypothetical protein